jgi:hypothetical protein
MFVSKSRKQDTHLLESLSLNAFLDPSIIVSSNVFDDEFLWNTTKQHL